MDYEDLKKQRLDVVVESLNVLDRTGSLESYNLGRIEAQKVVALMDLNTTLMDIAASQRSIAASLQSIAAWQW